jgi:phage gpG-like protein
MIAIMIQDEPARAAMAARRSALADLGRLHASAGARLVDWVHRNFRARGALVEGMPWPPLAPATLAARRRRGLGAAPLEATGRLRRGIALRTDPRAAVLSNAVPYAAAHQFGFGVPRRPFFPEALQTLRIVFPAAEAHVREALA